MPFSWHTPLGRQMVKSGACKALTAGSIPALESRYVVKINKFRYEANPRIVRMFERTLLDCSFCKPNQSENQHRKSKVRGLNMISGERYRNISWKILRRDRWVIHK